MLVASVAEMVSIGLVLPFLGALTSPELVFFHPITQELINTFQLTFISQPHQIVLPFTIAFIILTLLASVIRLTLLYTLTKISFMTGADLSIDIYRRTLYQDYSTHIARNSSEVVNGIIVKTGIATSVIRSFMTLLSSLCLLIGVISILLIINTGVAFGSFVGFGLLYWCVIRYTRAKLKENSETISQKTNLMVKSLQEGLGGIRDVIISGSQNFYTSLYRKSDIPVRKAASSNAFISQSPRFAMEALGITLIAILAFIIIQMQDSLTTSIPLLGAMALGAQKLLPILQNAYSSFSDIRSAKASFKDVMILLEQPLPSYLDQPPLLPIKFEKEIQLNNINFRYTEDTPLILKNVNLKLIKGERIGFMGVTGAGKSTLIDIIIGLLPPTDGEISIDNKNITKKNRRAWQEHIAHVPQNIYLSDRSIEENIAFGIPKDQINQKQLKKAAKQAQISELIENFPNTYKTLVGEQGVRLSGGQRQRIGIARALYKGVDVLIFDEATSSLDDDTEVAVMKAINKLDSNLTIIIIAHRLTTLKGCDQIVKINENNTIEVGNYQGLVELS